MATEQQISKLAGVLVEHQSGFTALSSQDAQWVITNPKEAISLFVAAVKNRATEAAEKAKEKLLEFVASFKVAGAEKFLAEQHFKKDTSETAIVKISWLGDDFKTNFLGLVEENVPEIELKTQKLIRDSRDPGIIVELGENYMVSLAHVWNAMLLQAKGGEGNLLTNGWANMFYVADVHGVVWAVNVGWDDGGWYVDADSVEDYDGWSAGPQVLSR
jgi:hypothetical protein